MFHAFVHRGSPKRGSLKASHHLPYTLFPTSRNYQKQRYPNTFFRLLRLLQPPRRRTWNRFSARFYRKFLTLSLTDGTSRFCCGLKSTRWSMVSFLPVSLRLPYASSCRQDLERYDMIGSTLSRNPPFYQ